MGRKGKAQKRNISETSKKLFAAFLEKDDFGEYCKNNNCVKFDQHPDVKACVKIYADLISSMTIHLMENTDSGDRRVKNALSNLIDIEPYKYTTRKTLMYKCVEELIFTGNSILIPTYNQMVGSNYIEQLVPIPQSAVTYNALDDGGYNIAYNKKVYAPDEIIHFVNNPNLNQPWLGESYKVYINDILLSLQQGQNMKSEYYTNHFKPKIAFTVDIDTDIFDSEDKREDFHNKWLKTKPGKPYIIPAPLVDFKSFPAMSLSDIALDANTKIDKLAIANIIGVPGFMVGVGSFNKDEYNNFINTRINPIVKEMQQEMTNKLIISPSMYLKFNIDSLKVFDTETRNQFLLSGKSHGIFNANEIRIETGYEPIDRPEMNEYSILENYIPVNKIGNQKKLNSARETVLLQRTDAKKQKNFAVDFDGTLVENKYPKIGKIREEIFEFIKRQKDDGNIITLWTCREGDLLDEAVEFCCDNGLEFDYINSNSESSINTYKNDSRKIHADYYLDDKNLKIMDVTGGE